mgnify:CR=1 FL=1
MPNADVIAPYASVLSRPVDAVVHDLESYAKLLAKWQSVQNLVSRETLFSDTKSGKNFTKDILDINMT